MEKILTLSSEEIAECLKKPVRRHDGLSAKPSTVGRDIRDSQPISMGGHSFRPTSSRPERFRFRSYV
jgi:hypothetical protein